MVARDGRLQPLSEGAGLGDIALCLRLDIPRDQLLPRLYGKVLLRRISHLCQELVPEDRAILASRDLVT